MAEGFILCYETKDEMVAVYKRLLTIKKEWFSILLYYNDGVPYPYTVVLEAQPGAMYDLDEFLVETNIGLGKVDMYPLRGREHEVETMIPIEEDFMAEKKPQYMAGEKCPGTDTHRVILEKLRPVPNIKFNGPGEVVKTLSEMKDYDREYFKIIYVDMKNRVLGIENIAQGTINATILHPREVVKGAVLISAAGVFAVHNHPSGLAEPSREDDNMMAKLVDAFGLMGIDLIDAIIIGKETYYSYKTEGRLPTKSGGNIQIMGTKESDETCQFAMEAAMSVVGEQCGDEKDEPEAGRFLRLHLKQELKAIHGLAGGQEHEAAKVRADCAIKIIGSGVGNGLISKEYGEKLTQAVQRALEKKPYLEVIQGM